MTKDQLAAINALLPEGVMWGDPLTPDVAISIAQEAVQQLIKIAQKQTQATDLKG